MARYLVRFKKDHPHSGDDIVAVLSADGPAHLFDVIDEEDNPFDMEFMKLPPRDKRYYNGADAPWEPFTDAHYREAYRLDEPLPA